MVVNHLSDLDGEVSHIGENSLCEPDYTSPRKKSFAIAVIELAVRQPVQETQTTFCVH
jgi:hypothetical protein